MDIFNPYDEDREESPGEQYQHLAGEITALVRSMGGPRLNEAALAVIIADLYAWFK